MIISEGLRKFIDKAVVKNKRDRINSFISNSKSHVKFARTLDHEFLSMLDHTNFRDAIDINSSKETGFLYCSNGVSNEKAKNFTELYGKAPWEGGWLIVNITGSFAIYRPEGKTDDEVFIEL